MRRFRIARCADPLEKKQLCFLLARHGLMLDLEDGPCAVEDSDLRDGLREVSVASCRHHWGILGVEPQIYPALPGAPRLCSRDPRCPFQSHTYSFNETAGHEQQQAVGALPGAGT